MSPIEDPATEKLLSDVVLFVDLTGALFSRFPFCNRDYNKLHSPFPDMMGSRRIDPPSPPPLPPVWRLVNVAQRGSIRADLIKRVAYEATAGLHTLLHRQLPSAARSHTH